MVGCAVAVGVTAGANCSSLAVPSTGPGTVAVGSTSSPTATGSEAFVSAGFDVRMGGGVFVSGAATGAANVAVGARGVVVGDLVAVGDIDAVGASMASGAIVPGVLPVQSPLWQTCKA